MRDGKSILMPICAIAFSLIVGLTVATVSVSSELWGEVPAVEGEGVQSWLVRHAPWNLLLWDFEYGREYPETFQKAYLFLYAVAGMGMLAAAHSRASGKNTAPTTYGSARWASRKETQAAGLLGGEGIVVGLSERGEYLRHDGPEHMMMIAPTRSGKGVGVVIPTLLSWPGSVIVYDLKSENWSVTAGYRSRFSHAIYFNPNDHCSAHFNPLLEVRKGDLEVRDVQNIADMIVDPEGKGLGDHWAKTGHSLLVGTILHVLYAEENKTLAGVADFLSSPDRTIGETLEAMMHADHAGGITHPVVAAAARDMLNKSENERSGVLSTAMSFLSLYRDSIVAKNTTDSDFRIVDLMEAEKPVSLYLVIPPSDINRLRPLFRLMINQICRRLTEELSPPGKRHRLLVLLDEFPALGRLDFFESALSIIAGYGIRAMLISQSVNQLNKTYGVNNSIIDNTHVRVFFAPNTIETAEAVSKMLGQKTEVRTHQSFSGDRLSPWLDHTAVADHEVGRSLLTPAEVMELPSSDELVFVAGYPPIRARKVRYYDDGNFKERLFEPPKLCKTRPYPYAPGSAPALLAKWEDGGIEREEKTRKEGATTSEDDAARLKEPEILKPDEIIMVRRSEQ